MYFSVTSAADLRSAIGLMSGDVTAAETEPRSGNDHMN